MSGVVNVISLIRKKREKLPYMHGRSQDGVGLDHVKYAIIIIK